MNNLDVREIWELAILTGKVNLESNWKLHSSSVKFLNQIKDKTFESLSPKQQDWLFSIKVNLTFKEVSKKQLDIVNLFGEFLN